MKRSLIIAAIVPLLMGAALQLHNGRATVANASGAYSWATSQSATWPSGDGANCECVTVWNRDAAAGDSVGVIFEVNGDNTDQVVLDPQGDQTGPYAISSCGLGLGPITDVILDTDDCTGCAEVDVQVTCAEGFPRP